MKHAVTLLAGCLIVGPVPAFQIGLTPQERSDCDSEGGCMLVSKAWIEQQKAQAAYEARCSNGSRT